MKYSFLKSLLNDMNLYRVFFGRKLLISEEKHKKISNVQQSSSAKFTVQVLPTSGRFHEIHTRMNEIEVQTTCFFSFLPIPYSYFCFIEEVVTKKKTELTTTRQIETRVKRQIVLEDGKVVEDSGPILETNTTEDTNKQESESVEVKFNVTS